MNWGVLHRLGQVGSLLEDVRASGRFFLWAPYGLKEGGCVCSGGRGAQSFLLPGGEVGWQYQPLGMEEWREGRGLTKGDLK